MDLKSLCQEVFDEIQAGYPARTLRYQPHGDLTGEWDRARLRQVVSNLMGNAVQHGHGTGPVELSVNAEGHQVTLAVRNEGPPIPADALPTIFDPLVRGLTPELQKQRRPGSIGLGLYIAREVVIAHGGTIEVKSSQDAGTTFTIRLPRRRTSS
jgi:signal transduction histidine kinase